MSTFFLHSLRLLLYIHQEGVKIIVWGGRFNFFYDLYLFLGVGTGSVTGIEVCGFFFTKGEVRLRYVEVQVRINVCIFAAGKRGGSRVAN